MGSLNSLFSQVETATFYINCSLSISAGAAHQPSLFHLSALRLQAQRIRSFYPTRIDKHLFSMSSQAALLKTLMNLYELLMNLYELLSLPEVVERVAAVYRSCLESVPDFHTSALPHSV